MIIDKWDGIQTWDVIVADPPWTFYAYSGPTDYGHTADSYYPTLTWKELVKLPIYELASKDSLFWLWAVGSQLDTTIELAKTWGFIFVNGGFTWAKTCATITDEPCNVYGSGVWHFGMGYYLRGNTEYCLLFKKGKPKISSHSVPQLLVAPYTKHSEKPEEVQSRMMRLSEGDDYTVPTKTYLELFARREREYWDCIGNELGAKQDIRDVLNPSPQHPPVTPITQDTHGFVLGGESIG